MVHSFSDTPQLNAKGGNWDNTALENEFQFENSFFFSSRDTRGFRRVASAASGRARDDAMAIFAVFT
jgi:hypothetical protein